MKARLINSQYNNNLLMQKQQAIRQYKTKEHSIRNEDIENKNRPAQAISFGGSALSSVFLESKPINKLIAYTNTHEAAFIAIFALLFAGILKPMLVLFQTGHDDKDGQMIATKNFLSAFIGFLMKYTIEGEFIKKITGNMIDNVKISKKSEDGKIVPDEYAARNIAKKQLKDKHYNFKNTFKYAKSKASESGETGFSKLKKIMNFWAEYKKNKYTPAEEEVGLVANNLIDNFKNYHQKVFNKNSRIIEFVSKLRQNFDFVENQAYDAAQELKNQKTLKTQPSEAFGSLWKNFMGSATSIAKAKITSLLLPATIAAIFAKRNAEIEMEKQKELQQKATNILIQKRLDKNPNFKTVKDGNRNTSSLISFNGSFMDITNTAIQKSSCLLENIAFSQIGQELAEGLSKISKMPSAFMSHIESWLLTAYWVIDIQNSKKIHPDQKLGFNIHTVLVTIVSSLCAFVIDGGFNFLVEKAEEEYAQRLISAKEAVMQNKNIEQLNENSVKQIAAEIAERCKNLYKSDKIAEKLADINLLKNEGNFKNAVHNIAASYSKDLNKFKSLLIFTMVVRFLVPVLTVKQSKKLKNYLVELTQKRKNKDNNENKTQKTA